MGPTPRRYGTGKRCAKSRRAATARAHGREGGSRARAITTAATEAGDPYLNLKTQLATFGCECFVTGCTRPRHPPGQAGGSMTKKPPCASLSSSFVADPRSMLPLPCGVGRRQVSATYCCDQCADVPPHTPHTPLPLTRIFFQMLTRISCIEASARRLGLIHRIDRAASCCACAQGGVGGTRMLCVRG